MESAIVLAMHGAPPADFGRRETGEYFSLHARLAQTIGPERAAMEQRFAELDERMRAWPRTAENDPYFAASQQLGEALAQESGWPVVVGFNEFCAPTLDAALDQAAALGAARIVVVTPMMTRGGSHSEVDIQDAVQRARERHPLVQILYAWPYAPGEVARFLAAQVNLFLNNV